jgi:hypothetical protein
MSSSALSGSWTRTNAGIEEGSDLFCAGRVLPLRLTLRQCGVITGDTLRARKPKPLKFTPSQESAFWETMTSRTFEVACPQVTEFVAYDDRLTIAQTKNIVAGKLGRPVETIFLKVKPGDRKDATIVPRDNELVKSHITWTVLQPSALFVDVFVDGDKILDTAAEETIREVTREAPSRKAQRLWLECEENRGLFERTWAARHRK